MNKRPRESMIAKLLEDLQNKGRYRDMNAIQKIIARIEMIVDDKIQDERVIDALTQMAGSDPDKVIRDRAQKALSVLGRDYSPPSSSLSRSPDRTQKALSTSSLPRSPDRTHNRRDFWEGLMKLISSLIISIVISIGVTLLIVFSAGFLLVNLLHFDPDIGFILWLQVAPITAIITLVISMNILLQRK